MRPETFHTAITPDAAAKFYRWQADHPGAFYLNRKTGKRAMLHRVDCLHVGSPEQWDPAFGDATKHAKHCHQSREALTAWARALGVSVVPCGTCGPLT